MRRSTLSLSRQLAGRLGRRVGRTDTRSLGFSRRGFSSTKKHGLDRSSFLRDATASARAQEAGLVVGQQVRMGLGMGMGMGLGLGLGLGLAAAAAVAGSTSLALAQGVEAQGAPEGAEKSNDADNADDGAEREDKSDDGYVAIFLDKASREAIAEHLGGEFAHEHIKVDHLTLQFNPSEEQYTTISEHVGEEGVELKVIAHVVGEKVETLYVDILGKPEVQSEETEKVIGGKNDESDAKKKEKTAAKSTLRSLNEYPHITLSVAEGVGAEMSNDLLAQVDGATLLEIARHSSSFIWAGELPSPAGGARPQKVTVRRVEGMPILTGTVCTNFRWQADSLTCKPPGECGFCKFMKAGPCGDVFTAWEDCIDACKKDDEDFVTVCGPQTIALKECVDREPEYYGALGGAPEEENSAQSEPEQAE